MRRSTLLTIAGGLALVGVFALGGWWYGRPTSLRVAVVQGSEDAQLVGAIAQNFAKEHENVRLKTVVVNDAGAAAAALEAGNADLAVVRSDIRLPLNGLTLALLHRNPALILSTRQAGVAHVADLRGRTVGVVKGPTTGAGNRRLLDAILAHYEVGPDTVTIVELNRDQVFEALSSGRVAAVLTVGALNTQALRDAVMAASLASGGDPVFVPVSEAKAMAQNAPVFESIEIVRGTFGGSPPKPAESVETLGVSVRLMATAAVRDSTAGEITKLLFSNRTAIAQSVPLAHQIEAPTTDRGAAIPTHPGAAAYLDDEEETFFDKYSDVIYISAMVLSVLGSAAAALASRMGSARVTDTDMLLGRLLDVLRAARSAVTLDTLEALEQETDELLIRGIAARNTRGLDGQTIHALTLALDQARLAIKDRRLHLLERLPAPPGPAARVLTLDGRAASAG